MGTSQKTHERLTAWTVLFELASPYKRRFARIALFALLATGADLLQPLIYRAAINDVAGLFVDRVEEKAGPPPAPEPEAPRITIEEQRRQRLEKTQRPHQPNYVAPRTRRQAVTTLFWSVALLFVASVTGYFLSLSADLESTAVACFVEAKLIQSTFGHVLKLPLSFFNRRGSGGLARRIDQSDQVAPVVSALSRQIVPEFLSIVGICAIMLTQSWQLTVAALAILPLYLLITRHAARR
ncbi:MAG: ABC transporter transmembrane domain-containing protein, partial [Candidatus Solibacter sp.]